MELAMIKDDLLAHDWDNNNTNNSFVVEQNGSVFKDV